MPAIEVQGHRGAMGSAPENTLPSFEIALDCGVTSIETDVQLTCDEVAVLYHDPRLGDGGPLVRTQTLEQIRRFSVPGPTPPPTPVAERFAQERGIDPGGISTLAEFFDFVKEYAGKLGEEAGKSEWQRQRASRLIFDLELKRFPYYPQTVADGFTGAAPALLERLVVQAIRQAGVLNRARIRSFDHRSVRAAKQLAPALQSAVLIYCTAPANIAGLLHDADIYCPDFASVDVEVVHQVHDTGKRIIPYTVNEPGDWERLIAWGVDGITTDYPERLIAYLGQSPSASEV